MPIQLFIIFLVLQLSVYVSKSGEVIMEKGNHNFITNDDGNTLTAIHRIFGKNGRKNIGESKNARNGILVGDRQACPFSAESLISSGQYHFCNESDEKTDKNPCPNGYQCDHSFLFGRSICCAILGNTRKMIPSNEKASTTSKPTGWNQPWYILHRKPWTTPTNSGYYLSTYSPTTDTLNHWQPLAASKPATTTTTTPTDTNERKDNFEKIRVFVLQTGQLQLLNEKYPPLYKKIGSISLIKDMDTTILVDTGGVADRESLLNELSKEKITLNDIDMVVITHGHPDHMGNLNIFNQKPIFFHTTGHFGNRVAINELRDRPSVRLSPNVELWKTPGHTQQDVSLLVHNVEEFGRLGIVGDLISSEKFIIDDQLTELERISVWNEEIQRQNANLMICMTDWIIPGHDQPFQVKSQYILKAGCRNKLK